MSYRIGYRHCATPPAEQSPKTTPQVRQIMPLRRPLMRE
jgi:hypothetical protein